MANLKSKLLVTTALASLVLNACKPVSSKEQLVDNNPTFASVIESQEKLSQLEQIAQATLTPTHEELLFNEYLEIGVPEEQIQHLIELGTTPLEAKYFINKNLQIPDVEITLEHLDLDPYDRFKLIENSINAEIAIPYLLDGWDPYDIIGFVSSNISAEVASPFKVFRNDDSSITGRQVADVLQNGKTAEDLKPYFEIGVTPICLRDALFSETPIEQANFFIEHGVDGCYFDNILEKYSFESAVEYLTLIENALPVDFEVDRQGTIFMNLILNEIEFNVARDYIEAGALPYTIHSIKNWYELTPEDVMEYTSRGIPSWAIGAHRYVFPEYSLDEIAPYFVEFSDELIKQNGEPEWIFFLIGRPIEQVKEYADLGVFLNIIPSLIDDNRTLEEVKSFTDLGFRDYNIISFLEDGIRAEQVVPYLENSELRDMFIMDKYVWLDLENEYFDTATLNYLIKNNIGPDLLWDYIEFTESKDIELFNLFHQHNITLDQLTNLHLKMPENYQRYWLAEELSVALSAGFSYDEFLSLIEEGYDSEFIYFLGKDELSKDEILDLLETGITKETYIIAREFNVSIETVEDYLYYNIKGDMIPFLYYLNISPEKAYELKRRDIPEYLMPLAMEDDFSWIEFDKFIQKGLNADTAIRLINRNIMPEQTDKFIELGFYNNLEMALFVHQDYAKESVAYYNELDIKPFLIQNFITADLTHEEIKGYEELGIEQEDMPHFKYFGILPDDLRDEPTAGGTYQSSGYRDIILERYEQGLILEDKLPLFETLNITQFQRYSVTLLDNILKTLNKEHQNDKPIALLLFGNEDEIINEYGAFNLVKPVYDSLTDGYNVILFEVYDENIGDEIDFVAQNYEYPSLIIVAGHSDESNLVMGTDAQYLIGLPPEEYIIDVNDKWDLAGNVTKYGMPDLVVVLGCSAGKGGSYDKDGRRVNNLANMIADVFRAPTIAMNTNTQIQYFIFNDDSTVKNAIFHHYSAPPEIYYP